MKSFRLLLAALLAALTLAPAAHAGITGVSQVPLLNITGTGTVKPNLMLLYDNSGSMAQNYTPDYIDDSGTCRSRSLLSGGSVGCAMGHPPFASADFNRQYYNPKVTYRPAVYADGSSYPTMNRANSSTWTAVVSDAFGVNKTNMLNAGSATTVNIVTGYPDVKWCTNSLATDCKNNTSAYTYPTDVYYTSTPITTNPYYYNIDAGEFCTDTNMTTCINGVAPTVTYPVAAKVRWCNSKALTSCQAKYTGAFIYPRFSNPASGAIAAYGTVVIGSTTGSNATAISSVTVSETGGTVTITNGSTPASAGTNSTTKARTEATDLALAIINKTGLANSYAACVRTPTGGNAGAVPDCQSVYGITLSADNVVAVIPVQCTVGAPNKSLSNCPVIEDASRSGWAVTATAPSAIVTPTVPSTALVNVTGTTTNTAGATPALPGISLNGVALLGGSLALGRNATAAQVAALIIARINASNIPNTTAYIGKNTITPACAAASATAVCIINTAATAGGISAVVSALTGNTGGNTAFTTPSSTAPVPAVTDAIPVTTTPLGAGSDPVFTRIDIVSTRTTYPRDANRTDCAGTTTCTYDEEMTNFANWYSYYKTRNQMMKTSVGQAFQPVTPNYKVGIVSLSEADASAAIPLVPKIFSGTDRAAWYTKLYAMNGSNSTPMRRALHTVGLMYANRAPYVATAGSEVVQFPCQQNFTFVTTDGYWNGNPAATVVNNDNVENADRFCTRGRGCLDPADQTNNSLADIALYWYNGGTNGATTSLRTELEDWTKPGLVPAAAGDNTRLHMNTYTLGLGVDGIMNYEANYDTAPLVGGDFYKLITGVSSGCPWNGGGAYNWPDPVTGDPNISTVQARVDDLWHAAINGRGKYFSASDPKQVIAGLSSALANIAVKLGAAAAAATSTPNISLQDNDIFSDTFTTVKWFGELSNKKIDTVTGIVGSTVAWTTSDTVGTKVAAAATDTRVIKMIDTSATGVLKDFKYASMTAFEKAWFDNKCASLAQCASLSTADRAVVNAGANIVDWLRGQQQYANDTVLRAYTQTQDPPAGQSSTIPIVLGDIASSKPAYMREPRRSYPLAGYSQFVVDNATRAPTVFVGANDGMLHAFNAKTGEEIWAYAPRITMKKLYLQASTTYGTNHQYTADGAPEIGDVKFGSGWKSVLVAGLNGGGRGYYALDVTDPANPKALWELCADSTVCTGALFDADLGLSFGNAQFGIWNGQWVVFLTSGYNNIPGTDGVAGGDGGGYLYIVDVSNGHILKKVATSAPSVSTPPGYAKITSTSLDPQIDPVTTYVYGGDNLGQMWRVDLTGGGTTAVVNRMGNAGAQQPITTRPDVTLCKVVAPSGIIAQRVVVFGTGRLLDVPDVANVDVQSLYMIKDSNTEIASWRGSSMVQQTLTKIGSGANANSYSVSNDLVNLNVKSGWYLDFDKNLGERINLDPSIVSGTVIAVTNLPTSSSACSVGGSSNIYQLNVCSGGFVDANTDGTQSTKTNSADFVAGTLLSANAGAVGFIVVRTPAGALKILVTTGNGGDPITVNGIEQLTKGSRKVGWRRVRN